MESLREREKEMESLREGGRDGEFERGRKRWRV